MAEQGDIDKLQQSIDTLKTEIRCLAVPYEEALSHRVYDNAKKKIVIFIGSWLTIITTSLAFVGFNAYDKVVEKTTDLASKNLKEAVGPVLSDKIPDLMKNADKFIETEIKKLVDEKMTTVAIDMEEKVDSAISESIKSSLSQSDVKLNEALKQIGNRLGDRQFEEKTQKQIESAVQQEQIRTADWSFYGVFKDGKWTRKAFEIIGDDKDSYPLKQNKIQALTAVNIRKAAPIFTENKGYSYPAVKGVINEGENITVQNVQIDKTPKGEYVWIQVERDH
jgi:hypothetical protein